ncbi:MAG: hypothetical protein GY930_17465 [bacterium]|nr:hypothetical protein [bacterium]
MRPQFRTAKVLTLGTLFSFALSLAPALQAAGLKPTSSPCAVAPTGDLDSKIVRRMDTITKNLNEVDQYLGKKDVANAKSSLKAATAEMAKIHSWYGGKFDEKHPDFVALTKRLAASTTKVTGSAPADKKKPTKKPVTKKGGSAKALNSKVARRISTITTSLDEVDKWLEQSELKHAESSLKSAKKEMKKIMEWHKGQFDEKHPDFVATKERLAAAVASIEGGGGLGAQAAEMAEQVKQVAEVLAHERAALKAGMDEVRMQEQAFGYADTDDKFASIYAETRASVERVKAVAASAKLTVKGFHSQFPDLKRLENLVAEGLAAIGTMEVLESFPGTYDRVVGGALDRHLPTSIDDNLEAFARGAKNEDFLGNAILNGERKLTRLKRVHGFTSALLGNGPHESAVMQAQAKHNLALEGQIATLAMAIAKGNGQEADARKLKLGSARFPSTTFKGGKWTEVEGTMKTVFEAYTKDKKVERVSVHSDWDQRTEARWRNDHWIVGTYRYVGGTMLAKLPDGRYRVYRVSFRRTQQANGDFGPLEAFGIGHSFEILAENINK